MLDVGCGTGVYARIAAGLSPHVRVDGIDLAPAVIDAAPGSVAAAHLNFMLACQTGAAALPRAGELEAGLAEAGFTDIQAQSIVPGEPFLAVRAVLR